MRLKKTLLVLTAVMLPVASIALLEGTAFAKKVTGTGNPTCHFGGTISFNPPLSKNGSAASKEVTTVTASLSSCSGGNPAPPASSVAVKPIKTKGTKVGKTKIAGTCSSFESSAGSASVKVKINWTGEKPSKFDIVGLHETVNPTTGEAGFTGSFPVAGSYSGTGTLGVYLTQASTAAIVACSGSISSLTIDRANSSGKL
jgi:hypothetical protein